MEVESRSILECVVEGKSSLEVTRAAIAVVLRLEDEISSHAVTRKCWDNDRESLMEYRKNA